MPLKSGGSNSTAARGREEPAEDTMVSRILDLNADGSPRLKCFFKRSGESCEYSVPGSTLSISVIKAVVNGTV